MDVTSTPWGMASDADAGAALWLELEDEQGARYFANAETGETSWTLPPGALAALSPVELGAAEPPAEGYWVEALDPTSDALYYYEVASGEISWSRPAEGLVVAVDQDPLLSKVLKIQCAARVRLARRRVWGLKQAALMDSAFGENDEGQGEIVDGAAVSESERVWVEVYDPSQQVLYYYCAATGETRWDPPTVFVSANESKEVVAAVSIQSMARGRQARHLVQKKRKENELLALRRQRQCAYMMRPESDREAECRRQILEIEEDQVSKGDRFFGIEIRDREVRRQLTEETLLATSELFWQRVNAARRQRGRSLDWRSIKMEEEAHKERARQAEVVERSAMEAEEREQCQLGDAFWGIQAEERHEAIARQAMEAEEGTSRFFSDEVNDADMCTIWAEETADDAMRLDEYRIVQEKRNQTKYMRWFYRQCTSVDQLLDYVWPTHERFTALSPASEHHTSATNYSAVFTRNGSSIMSPARTMAVTSKVNRGLYKLDDLIVRERLENGDLQFGNRPILTIHHPNKAKIEARRGRFDIGQVETTSVFNEAVLKAKKPNNTSPYRPPPPRPEIKDLTVESERGPTIRYQRSQTPDPNIPARFNGVPFTPSQISPTREILCADHRKLTQIPSLSSKSSTSAPKLSKKHNSSPVKHKSPGKTNSTALKKKYTKLTKHTASKRISNQEPPKRHLSIFDHDRETVDPMMTSFGFLSPFAAERRASQHRKQIQDQRQEDDRDAIDDEEEESQADHPTFAIAREFDEKERPLVEQVFRWMDLDSSGTVDRREISWALTHDQEVLVLAKQSSLLRLLLKQRSFLDQLFAQLDAASLSPVNGKRLKRANASKTELSEDQFVLFCKEMYIRLVDQGLLPRLERVDENTTVSTVDGPVVVKNEAPPSLEELEKEEELTIRRVFRLLDADSNGLLERQEICAALYESVEDSHNELSALISASRALQPLLHQSLFMKAFTSFESADPSGICEEEFVTFCLEIAEVAAANNMI